jgi:hypothetical protein
MTHLKIALASILLLVLAAPAHAGPPAPDNGICPAGFNEMFNVNGPGCTLCSAPTDCQLNCLGPPACFCSIGDTACCSDNPCCFNCPEPKPLSCSTSRCICNPESCCSTICPAAAPTNSAAGLAILTTVLVAFGMGALRAVRRRR